MSSPYEIPFLSCDRVQTGKRLSAASREPRTVYVRFDGTPIRSMMRRNLSRTGGGGCAQAFLTSIFHSASRLLGMSMRTRHSLVSSSCRARPNHVPWTISRRFRYR